MIRSILSFLRLGFIHVYPNMRPFATRVIMNPQHQITRQSLHRMKLQNNTFSVRPFSSKKDLPTNKELQDRIFHVHGVKLSSRNINSLKAWGVFEKNSMEQLDEKLFLLKEQLLLDSDELRPLMVWQGMLLNLSREELKERINLFREGSRCSPSQLKELFLSKKAKKIQSQTNEQLTRMLEIYKGWGIKEEDLPSKLSDSNHLYKYQKQIGMTNTDSFTNYNHKCIDAFFVDNLNIKLEKLSIDKLINVKVFQRNDPEELKEKMNDFISKLHLSQEESMKLRNLPAVFWNESFENLQDKFKYFEEIFQSSEEKLKKVFLIRKALVIQNIEILHFQHAVLSAEYRLPTETIGKLFLNSSFSPIHLPEIVRNLAERKIILDSLFPSRKKFFQVVEMTPRILWISAQGLMDVVDALIEEGLVSSIEDPNIHRIFIQSSLLLQSSKSVIKLRVRNCALLFTQSELSQRKSEVNSRAVIDEKYPNIAADQEALLAKYQLNNVDSLKDRIRIVINSEPKRKLMKQVSKENAQEEERFAAAFFMKDRPEDKEQLLSLMLDGSISEEGIKNPYYRMIVKILRYNEQIDLLKEIKHEDPIRTKIQEGLRKGERLKGEVEKIILARLMMKTMKVMENLRTSEENAIKIIVNSSILSIDFSLIVEKLFLFSVYLHLEPEELISILVRFPILFHYSSDSEGSIFDKLVLLVNAAAEYLREKEESPLKVYLQKIPESMTIDETTRNNRDHPLIELVREAILQRPGTLTCSCTLFNAAIHEWKQQPLETRKWTKLPGLITNWNKKEPQKPHKIENAMSESK